MDHKTKKLIKLACIFLALLFFNCSSFAQTDSAEPLSIDEMIDQFKHDADKNAGAEDASPSSEQDKQNAFSRESFYKSQALAITMLTSTMQPDQQQCFLGYQKDVYQNNLNYLQQKLSRNLAAQRSLVKEIEAIQLQTHENNSQDHQSADRIHFLFWSAKLLDRTQFNLLCMMLFGNLDPGMATLKFGQQARFFRNSFFDAAALIIEKEMLTQKIADSQIYLQLIADKMRQK